MISSSIYRK